MDTIFMNSKNSGTSIPQKLLLNITDKINLKKNENYAALSNLSIYDTWKNVKMSFKNNKFKISALTQNEKFELTDGLYPESGIQDYFKYIFKKTWRKG